MIWVSDELARALLPYRGQKFLGAVYCVDCLEIVFQERGRRPNLLCLNDDGTVSHGFVDCPSEYVAGWREAA